MGFASVGPAAHAVSGTTRLTNATSVPIPSAFVPRRLALIAQECEVFILRPAGPSFVPIHGLNWGFSIHEFGHLDSGRKTSLSSVDTGQSSGFAGMISRM